MENAMKHSLFTIILLITTSDVLQADNKSVPKYVPSTTYQNFNPSPLSELTKIRNSEIYDIDISLHILKASPIEVSGNEPWENPINKKQTCFPRLMKTTLC